MAKITVVKCFIVQAPGRKAYNNKKIVFYTFSPLIVQFEWTKESTDLRKIATLSPKIIFLPFYLPVTAVK